MSSDLHLSSPARLNPPLVVRPATLIVRAVAVLVRWQKRAEMRLDMERLSDAALRDIGLTRAQVTRETREMR